MLALLFGILSAGLMFAFLNSRGGDGGLEATLSSSEGAESVLVVTRDIAVGEKITKDDVALRTVSATDLLNGRLTKNEDVVDKVATAPMFQGEQVLAAKVTTYVGQTTLSYKVPEGLRALSVIVPHEAWANGGLAQPGDRVDVLGVSIAAQVDPLTGQERTTVLSGVIAENVEVLAVAQTLVRIVPNVDAKGASTAASGTTASGAEAPKKGEAGTFQEALSVTLALTPEQAAKVGLIDVLKDDQAQYRIMTRQKGDDRKLEGRITWGLEDVFDLRK